MDPPSLNLVASCSNPDGALPSKRTAGHNHEPFYKSVQWYMRLPLFYCPTLTNTPGPPTAPPSSRPHPPTASAPSSCPRTCSSRGSPP